MDGRPTYEELLRKIKQLERKAAEYGWLEEVYRSVAEFTSDSIYLVDRNCAYLFINNHHKKRLGLRAKNIIGKRYADFHTPEEVKEFTGAVTRVFSTGRPFQHEHKSSRDKRYFLRTFSPVKRSGPRSKITGVVVVSTDITEQKLVEEAIRESEQKYRTIIENIEDGYHEVDLSGNTTFFNDALLKMLGYSRDEFAGMNYRDFIDGENAKILFQTFHEVYETRKPSRGVELVVRRKDGANRNVEVSISLIRDAKGKRIGYRNLIRDVTERKRTEETIRRLAYHDPLTGLPNRLLFRDRLNMAIAAAKRYRQHVAVMLLDLDNFKDINDTLGHHVGDQLLQKVGQRLVKLLRKGDTVSRMGGDEFLLLLPEIKRKEVTTMIAQKIVEAFGSSFVIDDRNLYITTSIGIAIYPDSSDNVDTLIKHADIAMYRVKESGRNNYRIFSPDMISRPVD
ncbi:MAG: diguanylate cyclase [Deltaproteobacteria bacterium]|nr:diguanylate cyclase [Deltaproteobacteria bacterium]